MSENMLEQHKAPTSSRSGGFPAATLHEAAGRIGSLPARLRPAYAAAELAGPAFPVTCPAGDNLWLHRALYAAEPGEVLVVRTTAGADFGYWGEILSEAAMARGLAGLVIDGGVRDTAVLEKVGLPVFSASICIRGTIKDPASPGTLGTPITLGDAVIRRGDLVVGDHDGVVVLPAEDVPSILVASQAREDKEADVIAQLRSGKTSLEIYKLPV